MLSGESLPIEAGPGVDTYAGALVRRGEATALVTATGAHTKFGRTAELVRTAHVASSQQKAVLRIVRNQTIHGPLREAQRFLNLKLQQRDNGPASRAAVMSLNQLLEQWLTDVVKARVRPRTFKD